MAQGAPVDRLPPSRERMAPAEADQHWDPDLFFEARHFFLHVFAEELSPDVQTDFHDIGPIGPRLLQKIREVVPVERGDQERRRFFELYEDVVFHRSTHFRSLTGQRLQAPVPESRAARPGRSPPLLILS